MELLPKEIRKCIYFLLSSVDVLNLGILNKNWNVEIYNFLNEKQNLFKIFGNYTCFKNLIKSKKLFSKTNSLVKSLSSSFSYHEHDFISEFDLKCQSLRLGLPDKFVEQGSQEQLRRKYGLDAVSIVKSIEKKLT